MTVLGGINKLRMAKGLSWDAKCYGIKWEARGGDVGRISGMGWERKSARFGAAIAHFVTKTSGFERPRWGKHSYSYL